MRKANKTEAPEFYTEFKTKKKPKKWEDIKPIISKLNQHILTDKQDNVCLYCEKHVVYNENEKAPPNPH